MKKIISVLFAFVLLAGMTVTSTAYSLQINTDKGTVGVGETVTVSVTLDEEITGSFRNVQGQLSYNPEILCYESHMMGERYSKYITSNILDRKYVTFTNTDFTEDGFSSLAAGSVITVTFKVNDSASAAHLKTALQLNLSIQDTTGQTAYMTAETWLTVCNGEVADEDTSTEMNYTQKTEICEKCGVKFVSEQSTDDEMNVDAEPSAFDVADGESETESSTNKWPIIGLVAIVVIAGALVGYRKLSRR